MIYTDYVLLLNTILKRNIEELIIRSNGNTISKPIPIPSIQNPKTMYNFTNGMDYLSIEEHNSLVYSQMVHDINCNHNFKWFFHTIIILHCKTQMSNNK